MRGHRTAVHLKYPLADTLSGKRPPYHRLYRKGNKQVRLLGKGDLLYKDLGAPVRLQGLVVTREELMELASP